MELINEGLALIFIGVLAILTAATAGREKRAPRTVYAVSAVMLFSMAVLSLFTGFNVNLVPFKLCPIIFSVSGILILQGAFQR
jgi:CHASE2 domain-containing sensor protein